MTAIDPRSYLGKGFGDPVSKSDMIWVWFVALIVVGGMLAWIFS